jgi:AcrR family transcriptional regulator
LSSVTRKTSSRRGQRREELLSALVPALESALAEGESYMEIAVGALASRAGISRSTFYSYVDDKGDILRHWFADMRTQLKEASSQWWALNGDVGEDELREALATLTSVYQPHAMMMAAVYDAGSYDSDVREQVAGLMDENIEALTKHIKNGQRSGWIDAEVLAQETASWLMWMAERTQHQVVSTADPQQVEAHIDAFTHIVWQTLYAPQHRAPAI